MALALALGRAAPPARCCRPATAAAAAASLRLATRRVLLLQQLPRPRLIPLLLVLVLLLLLLLLLRLLARRRGLISEHEASRPCTPVRQLRRRASRCRRACRASGAQVMAAQRRRSLLQHTRRARRSEVCVAWRGACT